MDRVVLTKLFYGFYLVSLWNCWQLLCNKYFYNYFHRSMNTPFGKFNILNDFILLYCVHHTSLTFLCASNMKNFSLVSIYVCPLYFQFQKVACTVKRIKLLYTYQFTVFRAAISRVDFSLVCFCCMYMSCYMHVYVCICMLYVVCMFMYVCMCFLWICMS